MRAPGSASFRVASSFTRSLRTPGDSMVLPAGSAITGSNGMASPPVPE